MILQDPHMKTFRHTLRMVYGEMALTICRIYNSIPNIMDMDIEDIEVFYNGIRSELKENTRPR